MIVRQSEVLREGCEAEAGDGGQADSGEEDGIFAGVAAVLSEPWLVGYDEYRVEAEEAQERKEAEIERMAQDVEERMALQRAKERNHAAVRSVAAARRAANRTGPTQWGRCTRVSCRRARTWHVGKYGPFAKCGKCQTIGELTLQQWQRLPKDVLKAFPSLLFYKNKWDRREYRGRSGSLGEASALVCSQQCWPDECRD